MVKIIYRDKNLEQPKKNKIIIITVCMPMALESDFNVLNQWSQVRYLHK